MVPGLVFVAFAVTWFVLRTKIAQRQAEIIATFLPSQEEKQEEITLGLAQFYALLCVFVLLSGVVMIAVDIFKAI